MGHHHHHDDDHEHYYDDTKLHDNQFIFLRHYLHMLQTCEEGVHYLTKRIQHEHTLDLPMLQDCLDVFQTLEDANFLSSSLMKKVDYSTYELIKSFDQYKTQIEQVKQSIENEEVDRVVEILVGHLFPAYLEWSMEVQKRLFPRIQQ
ncbi:hypothetical protein [Tepidibacillus fermentans]|uniref:DUF8042 domain-containing protein n=1 Tax=Tepidibacillus fermentans TaxID=1281767 RepID=A0A4R3KIR2_9BACI|nr:hypothetical protein [Tepidibacillus fermentans]TCS83302.1 hypothetical protein EDD72_10542 [Tepidibacillus fermentans]